MIAGRTKVLVAMSGGVDSSVAAALLKREGHEVVGCFMRLGSPGETLDELTPADGEACVPASGARTIRIGHQGCCSISDAADARLVAARLGIPFYVCNFRRDFGRIIDYFVDEYARGRTPNPCVRCNDWLKFGKLHEYAKSIGATHVASGHYARISPGERPSLLRGADYSKDQSYVLFGIPREQLGSTLFPIGGLPKNEVRAMARDLGLPVFDKPDSQEICFVPDNDYAGLVERRRPALAAEGPILNTRGERIGTHDGQHRFTIGQRRGVGVAAGEPLYVIRKDASANSVTVGGKEFLRTGGCEVGEANWLCDAGEIGPGARVLARFRYNSAPVSARVWAEADGTGPVPSGRNGRFLVRFEEAQLAVAPGQAMVLYAVQEPDRVLGGGWIERVGVERG